MSTSLYESANSAFWSITKLDDRFSYVHMHYLSHISVSFLDQALETQRPRWYISLQGYRWYILCYHDIHTCWSEVGWLRSVSPTKGSEHMQSHEIERTSSTKSESSLQSVSWLIVSVPATLIIKYCRRSAKRYEYSTKRFTVFLIIVIQPSRRRLVS